MSEQQRILDRPAHATRPIAQTVSPPALFPTAHRNWCDDPTFLGSRPLT